MAFHDTARSVDRHRLPACASTTRSTPAELRHAVITPVAEFGIEATATPLPIMTEAVTPTVKPDANRWRANTADSERRMSSLQSWSANPGAGRMTRRLLSQSAGRPDRGRAVLRLTSEGIASALR
jgi:hypothetical protein